MFNVSSKFVILSEIEGLGEIICNHLQKLSPSPKVYIPNKTIIQNIKQNKLEEPIDEQIKSAEFFIADPNIFSNAIPHVTISKIKVIQCKNNPCKNSY